MHLFFVPLLRLLLYFTATPNVSSITETEHHYSAGKTTITLRKTSFDSATFPFLILLHNDETTAAATASAFLQQQGGTLLSIQNNQHRYVSFRLHQRRYVFDPNRIFTQVGLRQNLQLFGSYSVPAAETVHEFGRFILGFVPDSIPIIALHNNTDGRYAVTSYKEDPLLRNDAVAVHINKSHDPDDFFITTDTIVYNQLKALLYNCVLQNNRENSNDGSLSVYYGALGRTYVNVETQLGHYNKQMEMLLALHGILKDLDEM